MTDSNRNSDRLPVARSVKPVYLTVSNSGYRSAGASNGGSVVVSASSSNENSGTAGGNESEATSAVLAAASAQVTHKMRMDRYVSSSLSTSITNANIVFETKIRIIDILQV